MLAVFMLKNGEPEELHTVGWYKDLEHMEDYLNHAGKPVPGSEHSFYDDPFEHRWDYAVVEKVGEGPMRSNKVVGWWKARYADGCLVAVDKLQEAPFDTYGKINFTL